MAWTTLINALYLPGKKILGATGMAMRDNLQAVADGDPAAPKVKDLALDGGAATAAGTTWVGLRTAGLAVGAVGSYALLRLLTPAGASPGTTHAGSALAYASANTSGGSNQPAGTWRLMGQTFTSTSHDSTSLFLRIS